MSALKLSNASKVSRSKLSTISIYIYENYRMNDPEYFGTAKPKFVPFDLDMALKCMYTH